MSEQTNPNQKPLSGGLEKYDRLMNVIGEMKRDLKAPYVGNKAGIERLKKNIQIARTFVRECSDELNRFPKD